MKNLCVILTEKGKKYIKKKRIEIFGSQMRMTWATGVPQINISKWEIGKVCPRWYAFRSYLRHLEIEIGFLKNREYVSGTKYFGFKIKKIGSLGSKMTKEKAYILGVVGPGDGWITDYSIRLNVIDRDFADYFQYCLERVFSLKCKRYIRIVQPSKLVKVSSKQYVVVLCSKAAVISLKRYKVSLKEKTWRIPDCIKKSTKGYKTAYLKGIFDSQGSIGNKQVILTVHNKEGIKEIKSLLNSIGIKVGITGDYRLFISGEKYLKLYNSLIGFSIMRKGTKLKENLNSYKQHQSSRRDMIDLLPKMIDLRKKGLTYKNIGDELCIHRKTISAHLRRNKYECSN